MKRILKLWTIIVLALGLTAVATPAQTASYDSEPSCVKIGFLWLKDDCKARNLYRSVAKKTVAGDAASVQKAVMMVGAGLGEKSLLQMEWVAYETNRHTARCARTQLLRFISSNASSMRMVGNVDRAFKAAGAGLRFVNKTPNGAISRQVLNTGSGLVKVTGKAVTAGHMNKLVNNVSLCGTRF
ncbi:hypothetical protein [Paeniglutamicibacter kerguelensis]|uniref:Lipoprotein n=1 Tax=Paeniglutamicibacter kerguelensis TaxID=254788 RepID=A0ABS4X834_9MICC|nr:hypothetical protein [Paeniglutamicibacter kerguelensis]MBP2384511.1 hypothetical protein [Paeniglutamicibacter kerguelensis]